MSQDPQAPLSGGNETNDGTDARTDPAPLAGKVLGSTQVRIASEFALNSSTAGIMEAIASLKGAGGKVFIPAGKYDLSKNVTIPSCVEVGGAGKELTVLNVVPGSGARVQFAPGVHHATLCGLTLHNNNNPSFYGIDCQYITLRNIRVTGGGGVTFTAFFPTSAGQKLVGWRVLDSDFEKDPAYPNNTQDSFGGGPFVDWFISNCSFCGDPAGGHAEGNIGFSSRGPHGLKIVNCLFYNNRASGTSLEDGARCEYVNCHARGNGGEGFKVDNADFAPGDQKMVSYSNCLAEGNQGNGFQLEMCDHSQVHGIASGNSGSGVVISGGQYCAIDVIAKDNGQDGVRLTQGATGRAVRHNTVRGIAQGNKSFGVSEGTGEVDFNLISGMQLIGNAAGALNKRGASTVISNNMIG
jgi:hypothetical protein